MLLSPGTAIVPRKGPLVAKEAGRGRAGAVMVGAAFDSAITIWQGARRFAG